MNQVRSNRPGAASELSDEELLSALPRQRGGREFRVGIFVLVSAISALVALFLLTDPSTFRGRYRISTTVEQAGGIRRGDPVQMRGVNVGRVMGFSMVPDGVEITLEIEGQWAIPSDSRTRLVSSGILGGRTVEIIEGTSADRVRGGGHLPGETAAGLLELPPDLGKDAQAVLARIEDLLAQPTVSAIRQSAEELHTLLRSLSALTDAQGAEIARLTASLNRSAQGLEKAADSGEEVAQAVARADSALAAVRKTSEALQRASFSLENLLRRVEEGEGTLGRLAADPTLYETLTSAAESVRLLAQDLREHPERYVKIEIF